MKNQAFGRRSWIATLGFCVIAAIFGNNVFAQDVCVIGSKFYDADTDGAQCDLSAEPGIAGWRVELWQDATLLQVAFTDGSGNYHFFVPANTGELIVKEVAPAPGFFPDGHWLATTATFYTIEVCECDIAVPPFGNVCLGAGGGHTLGFWSNKNGQRVMTNMTGGMAGTLAFLSSMNLRTSTGADFNPNSYTQFRTWLRSANAVNMAYMLSAQFVAMALNVRSGFVDAGDVVYAPGINSADSAGFASIAELLAEANAALGNDGNTPAGDLNRAYQESLKNALDNANNNLTFVEDGPCEFVTPY